MFAKIKSSYLNGIYGVGVDVECDVSSYGLPSFSIVGLGDNAIKESKERVKERYGDNLGQQPRNIFGECEPHAVLHTIEQAFACRHYQQRPGIEYSRQEQMPHVGETEPDGIRERRVYGHEHERESKHEYHRPEQVLFVE